MTALDDKNGVTPLQRILTSLAANRCYACGWPLGTCQPFNCAMRYNDDQKHIAEREGWLERQRVMSAVLIDATSTPSHVAPSAGDVHSMTGVCPTCGSDANETTPSTTPQKTDDFGPFDPAKLYREFPAGGNNERGDWLTRCLTFICARAVEEFKASQSMMVLVPVDEYERLTTASAMGTLTYRGSGEDLGTDILALGLNDYERRRLNDKVTPPLVARPLDEWHEDLGNVIWWRIPVEEPPWVGTPLDSDWTDGYYTHFTPLVIPANARADGGKA